jgi:hypothetical protein
MWFQRLVKIVKYRRQKLWIAPVTGAILATALASAALFLDQVISWDETPFPIFSGTADTARTLLQVIASSVTTLIALIFTILVVAIQLASSQYSPRALTTLLQDRPSHFTIGIFVGTFTYTLIILLGLRLTEGDSPELVPAFQPRSPLSLRSSVSGRSQSTATISSSQSGSPRSSTGLPGMRVRSWSGSIPSPFPGMNGERLRGMSTERPTFDPGASRRGSLSLQGPEWSRI